MVDNVKMATVGADPAPHTTGDCHNAANGSIADLEAVTLKVLEARMVVLGRTLDRKLVFSEVQDDCSIRRLRLRKGMLMRRWRSCLRSGEIIVTLLHAAEEIQSLLSAHDCPLLPLQKGATQLDWLRLRVRFLGNWRNILNVLRYMQRVCPQLNLHPLNQTAEEVIVDCIDTSKSDLYILTTLAQCLVLLQGERKLAATSLPAAPPDPTGNADPPITGNCSPQQQQPQQEQPQKPHIPLDFNNNAGQLPRMNDHQHQPLRQPRISALQQLSQQPKMARLNAGKRVTCVYDTTTEEGDDSQTIGAAAPIATAKVASVVATNADDLLRQALLSNSGSKNISVRAEVIDGVIMHLNAARSLLLSSMTAMGSVTAVQPATQPVAQLVAQPITQQATTPVTQPALQPAGDIGDTNQAQLPRQQKEPEQQTQLPHQAQQPLQQQSQSPQAPLSLSHYSALLIPFLQQMQQQQQATEDEEKVKKKNQPNKKVPVASALPTDSAGKTGYQSHRRQRHKNPSRVRSPSPSGMQQIKQRQRNTKLQQKQRAPVDPGTEGDDTSTAEDTNTADGPSDEGTIVSVAAGQQQQRAQLAIADVRNSKLSAKVPSRNADAAGTTAARDGRKSAAGDTDAAGSGTHVARQRQKQRHQQQNQQQQKKTRHRRRAPSDHNQDAGSSEDEDKNNGNGHDSSSSGDESNSDGDSSDAASKVNRAQVPSAIRQDGDRRRRHNRQGRSPVSAVNARAQRRQRSATGGKSGKQQTVLPNVAKGDNSSAGDDDSQKGGGKSHWRQKQNSSKPQKRQQQPPLPSASQAAAIPDAEKPKLTVTTIQDLIRRLQCASERPA